MVKNFTFSRSKRSDVRVSKRVQTDPDSEPIGLPERQSKNRFKKPTEVLKNLNVSLMSKLEELRVLPMSYSHDEIGSFFYDELEFFNTTESSINFKTFYLEIVDLSQSLPIVLLNKQTLLSSLLIRLGDAFFLSIVSKLLVALLRDCGEELYPSFVSQALPALSAIVDQSKPTTIETVFRVLACGLKCLVKAILADKETFFRALFGNFLSQKNKYLRRYTAECAVFVLQKIRQKNELIQAAKLVFTLGTGEGGDDDADWVEDFQANLLFLLLKGEQGLISYAGVELTEFVGELLAGKGGVSTNFFLKTFNLLVENEYKFYRVRSKQPPAIGKVVTLEDYLLEIAALQPRSETLRQILLSILTEVLLFGSGQRFSPSLLELSISILTTTISPVDLLPYSLPFLAKYMTVTHSAHPSLSSLPLLSPSSLHLFYSHLYLKDTFERTVVHRRFQDKYKLVEGTVSRPTLEQSALNALIPLSVQGIEAGVGAVGEALLGEVMLLFSETVEKGVEGGRINLPQKVYSLALSWVNRADWEEGEAVDEFFGACKILALSTNLESDGAVTKPLVATLLKLIKGLHGEAKEHPHLSLANAYNQEYIGAHRKENKNMDLSTPLDRKVTFACMIIQLLLVQKGVSQSTVETLHSAIESLSTLKDNYTIFVQTLFSLKKILISNSRKQKKPVLHCCLPHEESFIYTPSPALHQRLLEYLHSDVPEARVCTLRILLPHTSVLLTQLIELDTTELSFYNERALHLLVGQICTGYYYQQYPEEESAVLYHHTLGMFSHRIATLQPSFHSTLAYLLFRNPAFFPYYLDSVLIANSRYLLAPPAEGSRWVEALLSTERDVVEPNVATQRVLDSLGPCLAYAGGREAGKREGKAEVRDQDVSREQEKEAEEQAKGANPVAINHNKEWTVQIFGLLEQLLKAEVQFEILPSLSLKFSPPNSSSKPPSLSTILEDAKTNYLADKDKSESKGNRISALERMKRLIQGLKASFTLPHLPAKSKASLKTYLLDVMKYPSEELQHLALTTLFKLCKEDRILKQYAPQLTLLTGKDNFKESLLKLNEKIGKLTQLEKEALQPVLVSLLYRRLVDRTGLANRRHYLSLRDFVFDTASAISPTALDQLLEALPLSHGLVLPRVFTPQTRLARVNAFLDMLEGVFSRVSSNLSPDLLHTLLEALLQVFSLATKAGEKVDHEAKRIKESVKAKVAVAKKALPAEDKVAKGSLLDIMAEEDVTDKSVPMNQELTTGAEITVDDENLDENEIEEADENEDFDEDFENTELLDVEEKFTLHISKQFKQMRQLSLKRIIQVQSLQVELDYSSLNEKIISLISPSLERLAEQPLKTFPLPLRLLGLWCECEYFKGEFTTHPDLFAVFPRVLSNPACSARVYTDTLDLMVKLEMFGLSDDILEDEEKYLQAKKIGFINGDEGKISTLGKRIIEKNGAILIEALALLAQRLEDKTLINIRNSDLKNMGKRISEFSLFLSKYCAQGMDTEAFLQVTSKAWNVEAINRKTAKPFNKIDTAHELMAVQKEIEAATNMLKILVNFCGTVSNPKELFYSHLLPLIAKLADKKLRAILGDCLFRLTENPSFSSLNLRVEFVRKLSKLHKNVPNMIRPTLDHNSIVEYLLDITPLFPSLAGPETMLLLAHCLYLLSCDDLSVRDRSLTLLSTYVLNSSPCPLSTPEYRSLIEESILYYLSVPFSKEHTLRSHTLLLRAHCLRAKREGGDLPFHDLCILINETDKDKDFFELVFSLKVAARGLAVKVISKALKKGHTFSPPSVKRVLTKLFDYYLYEIWKEAKKESTGFSVQRIDTLRNIVAGIIEIYGSLVGMLPFSQYVRLLKDKIFQLEGRGEEFVETSMRVICSCLNHLSPLLPNVLEKVQLEQDSLNTRIQQSSIVSRFMKAYSNPQEVAKARLEFDLSLPEKKDHAVLSKELESSEPMDEEGREKLSDSHYRVLKLHILSPLKRHLLKKDEKEPSKMTVRSDVAQGIIQLIKLFPLDVFNSELIGTINRVCSVLKDRDEDRRKTARTTLISMLRVLGPFFFGFFVKELSVHLARGYEAHIRNYTLYKLVEVLISPPPSLHGVPSAPALLCGQMDYTLPMLYPLLLSEVCGELEEEKEVQEIKNRSIEFRKNKATDCFRMLASKLQFSGEAMLDMTKAWGDVFFKGHGLSNILGKMNELGQQVIAGLMTNPTLSTEAIILLVKALADKAKKSIESAKINDDIEVRPGMDLEATTTLAEKLRNTFKVQEGASQGASIFKIKAEKKIGRAEVFGQFLAVFSTRFFQRCLKLNKVIIAHETKEDRRKSSDMLEPLVVHVVEFLGSTNSDLMQASLEIVGHILHWPIYCVRKNNRKMLRLILKVLENNESNDLNITQSCFKMVRRILKANRYFLAPSQLTEIVHSIRENLYPADWVNEPLHCFNLLVTLKVLKPEMYDVFEEAFALMITTKYEAIKRLLKEAVLNFIQNFPLSEQLLERIMLRLVNNLDYAEKEGRAVVLDVLNILYTKLPLEALQAHLEVTIFGLVTRLVNEEVTEVKAQAEEVLKALLLKMQGDDKHSRDIHRFFDSSATWLQSETEGTQRAGLQLLKMLFSATGDYSRVDKTLGEVLVALDNLSKRLVQFWEELKVNEQLGEVLKDNQWKDVFFDERTLNPENALVQIKNTKGLVRDYLSFLEPLLTHPKTKEESRSNILGAVLTLSRHPDEEIQVEVLGLVYRFLHSSQAKAGIVNHHLKALLMALFSAAKSKHLSDMLIPTLTGIVGPLLALQGAAGVGRLRQTLMTAISSITFKFIRFGQRYSSIVAKSLALARAICENINSLIGEEELSIALSYWFRLAENGWVRDQKELLERIDAVRKVLSRTQSDCDSTRTRTSS